MIRALVVDDELVIVKALKVPLTGRLPAGYVASN